MKLVKYSTLAMGLVVALATLSPRSASAKQSTTTATKTTTPAATAAATKPA